MRRTIALAVLLLALMWGCKSVHLHLAPPPPGPGGPGPQNPPDFQGRNLSVWLNTMPTKKINPQGNDNRWWVPPVGPTPGIRYAMNTNTLGNHTGQDLIINPMQGNNIIHNTTYRDTKIGQFTPGFTLWLNNLERSIGGAPPVPVPGLPKGKYMFVVRVNGNPGRWDEQHIVVNVK